MYTIPVMKFLPYIAILFILTGSPILAETVEELNKRGVDLAEKKRYDEALDLFRKAAAAQDKQSAKAFHNRGWVMELQGNINGAIENYREAIRRDPTLADSYERIGYWYYRTGKYADAITMGEKVLKLDPSNEDVKKWIVDAYKKRTERPGQAADTALAAEKSSPTAVESEPKAAKEDRAAAEQKQAEKEQEEKKKEEDPAKLFATVEFTLPVGYYYKGSTLKWAGSGGVISAPYTVDFYIKPIPKSNTRFEFITGTPFLGAGMPHVVNQYERIEGVFSFGPFSAGGGFMISHYNDDSNFGEKKFLTDIKIGAVFEYTTKESTFSLVMYPRLIPFFYDDKSATGKTFDACITELKYRYILDDVLSYYSRISLGDYYFFDNDLRYSNYWGYYDIAIGLTLGNKGAIMGKDLFVTVEIGRRTYLERLGVTNPYATLNGCGYFGIDKGRTGGKIFSGYHGVSNIFMLSGSETINEFFFIYQRLNIEFADRHTSHHEFALTLGAGGKI